MNLFKKPFRATGKAYDITNVNYNLLGLHKKEYFDSNGDLNKLELYVNYNQATDVYTNLAIKEDRVYTRDSNTGLLTTRSTDITWYDMDGGVNATKSNQTKYFSAKKGFVANKRARQNLVDNASMYLYSQLMQNNGGDKTLTDTQIDAFEDMTDSAQSKYIKSNANPLLDIVTNTTESYITEAIRTVLLSILDVSYAA